MKIEFIDIQNFRKLKKCRIDLSDKETVLVGPNNSGKTTAMEALILFLKKQNFFTTRDFTLSNWKILNKIGQDWLKAVNLEDVDLTFDKWEENIPMLDVWFNVNPNEIHYVNDLIPTLDWKGGLLGVRMIYQPKNIQDLYQDFSNAVKKSKDIVAGSGAKTKKFQLGPKDLWAFLDQKTNLNSFFEVNTYLLDPTLFDEPQKLPLNSIPIDKGSFQGLVRVDLINAQRGLGGNGGAIEDGNDKILSNQLRSYYEAHLNPSVDPNSNDIEALKAIQNAKKLFDKNLKESFKSSLEELEFLNYPGFGNPKINLSSNFSAIDSLNHDSSVQYNLDDNSPELSLPEKYNGLGYQNLISIVFKLIRFRDDWMQVGKRQKNNANENKEFEPIHLVLIEEPEAHLHAQVQQVFIKQAYSVLRKNLNLEPDDSIFTTQLLISTHSNHIAHEIDFTSLRYFKREIPEIGKIDTSTVVNLSKTFGTEDSSTKFAIRYLKTTHCDLFFADAVIIVEGPVERMLLPYFISEFKNSDGTNSLSKCYISILEIGGSHAHRLRQLVENLGIVTLIVTDIDSIGVTGTGKVQPEKGKKYRTGNDTLSKWLPSKKDLDELLSLKSSGKVHKSLPIRVAYQTPISIPNSSTVVFPYTFEDSLVMENKLIFKNLNATSGLLKKMKAAASESDSQKAAKKMYDAITAKSAKKAEFALELLYLEEPKKLVVPKYIKEGLLWLDLKLSSQKKGLIKKISK